MRPRSLAGRRRRNRWEEVMIWVAPCDVSPLLGDYLSSSLLPHSKAGFGVRKLACALFRGSLLPRPQQRHRQPAIRFEDKRRKVQHIAMPSPSVVITPFELLRECPNLRGEASFAKSRR